jgi:hypothetical protein
VLKDLCFKEQWGVKNHQRFFLEKLQFKELDEDASEDTGVADSLQLPPLLGV